MTLYALDPTPLREFSAAFAHSLRSPSEWSDFLQVLGQFREPSAHFSPGGAQILAAPEELDEPMLPSRLPSAAMQALVLQLFARWTAIAHAGLGEGDFFGYPYRVPKSQPGIESSAEWRHVVERLLCPGRIPPEFPFLKANPDNSVACCMEVDEVQEFLRLERQERLVESGIILKGRDSDRLLGLLHLAASNRCMIWHCEGT